MRALMRRLGSMGKTIIVSSHILPELADVCNTVGIIDSGVLIANNDVTAIIRQVRPDMVILIEPAQAKQLDQAAKITSQDSIVKDTNIVDGMVRVTLRDYDADYSSLSTLLVNNGIAIRRFSEEEINLESAFMAFTKGAGAKI
jgi:ABC-2 type transport system ATP-binding protein